MTTPYVPKFLEGEWHAVRLAPGTHNTWTSGGTARSFHAARSLCRDLNGESQADAQRLRVERKLNDRRIK